GGPGAGGSRLIPYFSYLFAEFNQSRDVILYDQRGTGYAEPSLTCDAYTVANFEAYAGDDSEEAGAAHAAEAFLGCYEAFLAAGIDMTAYNSAESAADLYELRAALGYEHWNLYGISYGPRLALTTMRDFPAGL